MQALDSMMRERIAAMDWAAQSDLMQQQTSDQQLRPARNSGGNGSSHDARHGRDETLAVLLPIIILLSSLLFLLVVSLIGLIFARRRRGGLIRLSDRNGSPTDMADEQELSQGAGGVDGLESRWLDTVSEPTKLGYIRAKAWQAQFPPNSQPTDITLTQFLSIQEKGVSAWCFEPDYDNFSPPFMITGRTEISFLADGLGMAPEEGGGSCVQSNLPIPKINEVYYFEAKLYEKPEPTNVAVGLATKPYPSFRLPGWNKHSVGYFSADGFKSYNYPFTATSYGPPLKEGDVLGVGYKPRNGTVFFTRNGRKLEDAYVGFNKHNVFPTIGADGPCMVHVNLGQSGFVFIEANVKKWGLAPSSGTLAPPPAYGSERGSILLETAANGRSESVAAAGSPRISSQPGQSTTTTTTNNNNHNSNNNRRRDRRGSRRHRHARVDHNFAEEGPSSSRLQRTTSSNSSASASSSAASTSQIRIEEEPEDYINTPRSGSRSPADPPTGGDDAQDEDTLRSLHNPHNPPTPNMLDISLHSLRPGSSAGFSQRLASEQGGESENEAEGDNQRPGSPTLQRRRSRSPQPGQQRSPSPPAYHVVDPNTYAPGVAEAMLGESFAAFQAQQAQNSGSPQGSFGSSVPSSAQYENRHGGGGNGEPSLAARVAALARNTIVGRPGAPQLPLDTEAQR